MHLEFKQMLNLVFLREAHLDICLIMVNDLFVKEHHQVQEYN